jgi:hypothetical protein
MTSAAQLAQDLKAMKERAVPAADVEHYAKLVLAENAAEEASRVKTAPDSKASLRATAKDYAYNGDPSMRASSGFMKGIGDMGVEAGGAAAGQALGAATGLAAPVAVPVLGAIGGGVGNSIAQVRRMNAGEQSGFHVGELLSKMAISAVPFGPEMKSGADLAMQGVKAAGAGVAAKAIETNIDEKRSPTTPEYLWTATSALGSPYIMKMVGGVPRLLDNPVYAERDAAFRALQPYGVKIAPHNIGRGSDSVSSAIGGAALDGEVSIANQPAYQKILRTQLGMAPTEKPIMTADFNAALQAAYKPFKEAAKISPMADDLVSQIRLARMNAKTSYQAYKDAKVTYADWQEAVKTADDLTANLEQVAKAAGKAGLADAIASGRREVARLYLGMDAVDHTSTGLVNINKLGGQVRDGALGDKMPDGSLDPEDKLAWLGRFANSFERNATRAGAQRNPEIINGRDTNVLPAMRRLVASPLRRTVTSDAMQAKYAQPLMSRPEGDMAANFARFLAMNVGLNQPNQAAANQFSK